MPASALMNVMIAAARKAGAGLTRDFGEVEQLQVSVKGPANFVTAADHRSEETHLQGAVEGPARLRLPDGGARRGRRAPTRPTAGSSTRSTAPPTSCTAFRCSASPSRWSARARSSAAWSTIRSSTSSTPPRRARAPSSTAGGSGWRPARRWPTASSATGIPHRGRPGHARFLRECKALMEQVAGIRRTGSAAIDLAWVAAGRFDGYVEHDLQPWDMAAGTLLVREAGGYVTDADGGHACSRPAASSPATPVHKALLEAAAPERAGGASLRLPARGHNYAWTPA